MFKKIIQFAASATICGVCASSVAQGVALVKHLDAKEAPAELKALSQKTREIVYFGSPAYVTVNSSAFSSDEISIELEREKFVAYRSKPVASGTGDGELYWSGNQVAGNGFAVIRLSPDGRLNGTVTDNRHWYQIRALGQYIQEINKVDHSRLPPFEGSGGRFWCRDDSTRTDSC